MQLHKKYQNQGFSVVAVSKQDPEVVRDFVKQNNPPFPFALDPNGSVAAKFQAKGTPNNFLVNTNGQIVAHVQGYKPEAFEEKIVGTIPRLLKEENPKRVTALPW